MWKGDFKGGERVERGQRDMSELGEQDPCMKMSEETFNHQSFKDRRNMKEKVNMNRPPHTELNCPEKNKTTYEFSVFKRIWSQCHRSP